MAMQPTLMLATGVAGLNVVLLLILTGIWVRNYRTFGSDMTLGLIVFGGVLLVENLTAIYYFLSQQNLYAEMEPVGTAVLVLRVLQFVALAFLTWVTAK
jgi:hypothetical protein